MRILFTLHNVACKGGSERVVINLCNALCEIKGYEIGIVSYYTDISEKEPYAYPINPKVSVSYLHNFDDIHKDYRGLKRILWRWIKPLVINYRMNRYKDYDIIIESDFAFFYPRFRVKNTKYIKIVHSVIKKWKKKNNLFDCIVFLNEQELLKWQKSSKHIVKIPNFIPILPFEDTLPKVLESVMKKDDMDSNLHALIKSHYEDMLDKSFYNDTQRFIIARSILKAWKLQNLDSINCTLNPAAHPNLARNLESCHTERSEVSSIGSKQSLDSINTDSKQDFSPMAQNDNILESQPFGRVQGVGVQDNENLESTKTTDSINSTNQTIQNLESNNPHAKHKLIAVGRMDAVNNHKGFPRLIDAYSKIAHKFPSWQLEIIGQDQGQKALLEKQILDLQMKDYILLKPFTSDMESVYLNADIFVMSSHTESMPMVLIEAASYGLPIVAYDIGTIRDCFHDNGILVKDNDEKAFCKALSTLMENEEKRIIMGQNGIKLAKDTFSKEQVLKQWLELFQSLTHIKS
ncbi:glycosyltransferase [Helicobacter bilis]|uniref:glycosyltransferase n=1 Tax=Helicobacter bilis TaxID=37372 RepID=UPI00248ECCA4|nr:glycosyltransferase [Helicobacter bilis]